MGLRLKKLKGEGKEGDGETKGRMRGAERREIERPIASTPYPARYGYGVQSVIRGGSGNPVESIRRSMEVAPVGVRISMSQCSQRQKSFG